MSELPKIDDKAPRRRASAAVKKASAPAKKPTPKTPATRDLERDDQLERARQAREAAQLVAQTGLKPDSTVTQTGLTPDATPAPDAAVTQTRRKPDAAVTQAVRDVVAMTQTVPKPDATVTQTRPNPDPALIVDASLVDVLKAVKTTSLDDFGVFLDELTPLVTLWSHAKTEGARRRHALAILLLIKEQF